MPGNKLLWDSQGHVTASSAAARLFRSPAVLSLSLALSLSLSWPSHPICPLYTKTLLVIEKQRGLLKEEE